MESSLWLVALVAGTIARSLAEKGSQGAGSFRALLTVATGAALAALGLLLPALEVERVAIIGAAAGLLLAAADAMLHASRFGLSAAWLIASGSIGLAYALVPAPDSSRAALGVAVGLAMGGALASGPSAGVFAIGGTSILWTIAIGEAGLGRDAALGSAATAAIAALALLAGSAISRWIVDRGWIVFLSLLALVGLFVQGPVPKPFASILLGVSVPLLVAWVLPSESKRVWPAGIAAGLAIAAAALSYAQDKGVGLAFLAMLVAVVATEVPRVWLTLSPIWLLAALRAFRALHPDAARALDIAQNYAILGVVLGIVVVLAVVDWARSEKRPLVAFAPAAILAVWVVLAGAALLGGKGATGLLVGLALAPCVAALAGDANLGSGRAAAALVGALTLGYGLLGPFLDWRRPDKIEAIVVIGGLGLLLAAGTLLSGRPDKELEEAA